MPNKNEIMLLTTTIKNNQIRVLTNHAQIGVKNILKPEYKGNPKKIIESRKNAILTSIIQPPSGTKAAKTAQMVTMSNPKISMFLKL